MDALDGTNVREASKPPSEEQAGGVYRCSKAAKVTLKEMTAKRTVRRKRSGSASFGVQERRQWRCLTVRVRCHERVAGESAVRLRHVAGEGVTGHLPLEWVAAHEVAARESPFPPMPVAPVVIERENQ